MNPENLNHGFRRSVNIKVLGVGGAGGNAINSMIESRDFNSEIHFMAANTDMQALEVSLATEKLQLGQKITRGLGAGSDPDIGRRAAEEDLVTVQQALENVDILFLTAGLGGGTGTGALPVIARTAKELGVLSVAIVTKPFSFEGRKRSTQAQKALEHLSGCADTIIVVPNERLLEIVDPKISVLDAFKLSNNILKQAVKGIADIIQKTGLVNVDFADVRAIIKDMGLAIMGTGRASGPERAKIAALEAINSPLLENLNIQGARGILLNITGNVDLGLHEINEAAQVIYRLVSEDANIILGSVIDENLHDEIMVTVIATGLDPNICQNVFKPESNSAEFKPSIKDLAVSAKPSGDESRDGMDNQKNSGFNFFGFGNSSEQNK